MGTVTDEGSAYGSTTVRPNRLLKDDRQNRKLIKDPKMIFRILLMMNFSFPVHLKVLQDHLLWLSGFIMIRMVTGGLGLMHVGLRNKLKNRKLWIIGIYLMYITSVGACPEASVKRASGYIIPDIHPCNVRVNLAERGIKELHFGEVYDNLRELNVSNNEIEYMLTGLFCGMVLDLLDLSQNSLCVIRKDSFNGSLVSWIDFSRNEIARIYEGAFEPLQGSLCFLNLAYNCLEELKKGTLSDLKSVTILDVSYNCLVSIDPDAFKGMDALLVLKLQGNQLTTVSGWLPPVGRQLDLSNNSLTTIEGLPQNANIVLNVSYNQFTCSVETKEFSLWCLQTENCHGLNDLTGTCYDYIDSDTSKGESPPITDHNRGNGVNCPHAYGVLTIAVSVLVGFYFAFQN